MVDKRIVPLLSISLLLILSISHGAFALRRLTGEPTLPPRPTISETNKVTDDFDRTFVQYLSKIDQKATNVKNDRIQQYKDQWHDWEIIDQKIAADTAGLVTALRNEAEQDATGKLTFRADSMGVKYCIPSDNSAKLMYALYKDGKMNTHRLLARIERMPYHLPPEWNKFLQEILAGETEATPDGLRCIQLLYRSGAYLETYREALRKEAVSKHNSTALETLMFTTDAETGLRKCLISADNIHLMHTLVADESQPLLSKAICAEYAFDIHDYDFSQDTVEGLMDIQQHPYKAYGKNDPIPEYDLDLYGVRQRIIDLMFYELRSPRMFALLYSRANIVDMQLAHAPEVKDITIRFDATAPGELEIDTVTGLIDSIKAK